MESFEREKLDLKPTSAGKYASTGESFESSRQLNYHDFGIAVRRRDPFNIAASSIRSPRLAVVFLVWFLAQTLAYNALSFLKPLP
jgi:hypothetical protein